MHTQLLKRFPSLAELWNSSRKDDPNNYFRIFDSPDLPHGAENQFKEWDSLVSGLDPESRATFLRKASGFVSTQTSLERGWTQLVECVNEIRGYEYAISLGYSDAKLVQEQQLELPDIEAKNLTSKCLVEVKTIQKSDFEIHNRNKVQVEESGLPIRLKRVLRKRYNKAVTQIENHPWAHEARKICYMFINPDLRTLLAKDNIKNLYDYLNDIEDSVEIHYTSQYWPAR